MNLEGYGCKDITTTLSHKYMFNINVIAKQYVCIAPINLARLRLFLQNTNVSLNLRDYIEIVAAKILNDFEQHRCDML